VGTVSKGFPNVTDGVPTEKQQTPAARDDPTRGAAMIKVRTFATPIKIFAAMREMSELDDQVAAFLAEEGADEVFSMSDCTTAGENGETIGLVRAVAYRVPD
jgi:hypothetical protein